MSKFEIFDFEATVEINSYTLSSREAIWQYLREKDQDKRILMAMDFFVCSLSRSIFFDGSVDTVQHESEFFYECYQKCFVLNPVIEGSLMLKSYRPRKTKRISEDFRECVLDIFKGIGLHDYNLGIRDSAVKEVTDTLMDKLPNIYMMDGKDTFAKAQLFLLYFFDTLFYIFMQKGILKHECKRCGCIIQDTDGAHWVEEYYYCEACSFFCKYHQRYEQEDDKFRFIENHGWVCEDGMNSSSYRQCESCKKYFLVTEIIESDDSGLFCKKCFKQSYSFDYARKRYYPKWKMFQCEWCGKIRHEDDAIIINSSLFCEKCGNKLFEIFSVIEDNAKSKYPKLFEDYSLDEITDFEGY